jgi:hypothetical protein
MNAQSVSVVQSPFYSRKLLNRNPAFCSNKSRDPGEKSSLALAPYFEPLTMN